MKIVTAFTVAHSVTLHLAALGPRAPARTAGRSHHRGLDRDRRGRLLLAGVSQPIWLVVFGFGLFHGFGFAGALEEMGLLREHLGLSLFGFNLGVELGQLAIVIRLFPLLFALRTLPAYRQLLLPAAAAAMIVVSTAWVLERAFDFALPTPRGVVAAVRERL